MTVAAPAQEAAPASQATAPPPPPTCTFLVGGVKRTCTAPALQGSPFCTHHAPGRVRCPVDPTHTVRPDRLQKHVKACTKATAARSLAGRPFYVPGVNTGRRRGGRPAAPAPALGVPAPLPKPAADRRAAAAALGPDRLEALIDRVLAAAEVLDPAWPAPPPPPARPPPDASAADARVAVALANHAARHAAQNDAIVAAAAGFGVFDGGGGGGRGGGDGGGGAGLALIELGAGRGFLGAAAAAALPSAAIALIDRRAYRSKADKHLRHRRLVRVTADIADVELSALVADAFNNGGTDGGGGGGGQDAVPCLPDPPITRWAVLGKHLCGRATDLALRAVVNGLGGGGGGGARGGGRPCGAAVATCCHHSAAWADFCGREAFTAAGFDGEAEFGLVSQFAAWALCGHGRPGGKGGGAGAGSSSSDDDDGAGDAPPAPAPAPAPAWQAAIPLARRHAAGAAAKRVLDGCRLAWLAERVQARGGGGGGGGGRVGAAAYVPRSVTGENRLLLVAVGGGGGGGAGL